MLQKWFNRHVTNDHVSISCLALQIPVISDTVYDILIDMEPCLLPSLRHPHPIGQLSRTPAGQINGADWSASTKKTTCPMSARPQSRQDTYFVSTDQGLDHRLFSLSRPSPVAVHMTDRQRYVFLSCILSAAQTPRPM